MTAEEMCGAEFSPCGKYRYKLWRVWDDCLPKAMCIGLNPSNADAKKNDPTINNLKRVLVKLGYGGFYMMNLFALITPYPDHLFFDDDIDPVGDNDQKYKEAEIWCNDVIFCWGAFKQAKARAAEVAARYTKAKCFGRTKDGSPMHPLAMMYAGTVNSPKIEMYDSGSVSSGSTL